MAGVHQAENLRAAFNNYNKVLEYTEEAYNSSGSAAKKYEIYMDGLEAKVNQVKTTFQQIVYQPEFVELAKGVLNLAEAFGKLLQKVVELKTPLIAVAGILTTIPVVSLIGKLKSLATHWYDLGKAMSEAATLSKMGKSALANLGNFNANAVATNKKQYQKILDLLGDNVVGLSVDQVQNIAQTRGFNYSQTLDLLTKSQKNLTEAELADVAAKTMQSKQMTDLGSKGTKLTSVFGGLVKAVAKNPFTWIGVAIAGFTALQWAIEKFALSRDAKINRVQELKTDYDQTTSDLESMNSELEESQKKIDEIKSKGVLSLVDQQEIQNLEFSNSLLENRIKLKEREQEISAKSTRQAIKEQMETKDVEVDQYEWNDKTNKLEAVYTASNLGDVNLTSYETTAEAIKTYAEYYNRVQEEISHIQISGSENAEQEIANAEKRLNNFSEELTSLLEIEMSNIEDLYDLGDQQSVALAKEKQAELNEIFRQTGLASEFGFEIPVDFSFTENINENLNQFINDLEGSEINIPLSMNLMESTDYQYQLDKLNAEVEKGTIDATEYAQKIDEIGKHANFSEIVNDITAINNALSNGSIQTEEYISQLGEIASTIDFSDIGEEGTPIGESLQATLGSLTTGISSAFDNIFNDMQNGSKSLIEISKEAKTAQGGINELATAFNSIKTDSIFDGALDGLDGLIDKLDESTQEVEAFSGYLEGLEKNADYLRSNMDDMGNVIFDSSDIGTKGYKNMIDVAWNSLQSLKQNNVGLYSEVVSQISSQYSKFDESMIASSDNFRVAAKNDASLMTSTVTALSNVAGNAISNMVTAGQNLLNALSAAISSFSAEIDFDLKPGFVIPFFNIPVPGGISIKGQLGPYYQ